eukprot:727233-Pyramimonas_sp.AAC.1
MFMSYTSRRAGGGGGGAGECAGEGNHSRKPAAQHGAASRRHHEHEHPPGPNTNTNRPFEGCYARNRNGRSSSWRCRTTRRRYEDVTIVPLICHVSPSPQLVDLRKQAAKAEDKKSVPNDTNLLRHLDKAKQENPWPYSWDLLRRIPNPVGAFRGHFGAIRGDFGAIRCDVRAIQGDCRVILGRFGVILGRFISLCILQHTFIEMLLIFFTSSRLMGVYT